MAAFFVGESPRPFSVVSENYQSQIPFIKKPNHEYFFSFGEVYEKAFCKLLSKYGEMNVDDRVCYIGPKRGNCADSIHKNLQLIYSIHNVNPGEVIYEETSNHHQIPVKIISYGAENDFNKMADECSQNKRSLYDKIILKDALEFFDQRKTFYSHLMQTLSSQGKLVILQRPGQMVTLPYPREARKRVQEADVQYMDVIHEIQELGFDVEWEIEILPVALTRTHWLSLMYHRFPNQLEIMSPTDVMGGLRELAEGSLKYSQEEIEFVDRLLIIVVTRPLENAALPECRRLGGSSLPLETAPQSFYMTMSPEFRPLVRNMEKKALLLEKQTGNKRAPSGSSERFREEWFGTVCKDKWMLVDSFNIPNKRINNYIAK